jgi:hypothetical protein
MHGKSKTTAGSKKGSSKKAGLKVPTMTGRGYGGLKNSTTIRKQPK